MAIAATETQIATKAGGVRRRHGASLDSVIILNVKLNLLSPSAAISLRRQPDTIAPKRVDRSDAGCEILLGITSGDDCRIHSAVQAQLRLRDSSIPRGGQ